MEKEAVEMRIPGFNAENSISGSRRDYFTDNTASNHAVVPGVLPQLPISIGFCMDDCDNQYDWGSMDNAYCKSQCSDDGGGGGTGGGGGIGGGGPQEHCGTCIKVGPHKGQKLCLIPGRGSYYTGC
jgi:hypothetical protein